MKWAITKSDGLFGEERKIIYGPFDSKEKAEDLFGRIENPPEDYRVEEV